MTSVADRRLKHEWNYRDAEDDYACLRCGQTGDLGDGPLLAYGGSIKPHIATVHPIICAAEDVHTPLAPEQIDEALAENPLPEDERFGDPASETAATIDEVHHRLLVGSDGRVAIQFTKPVEFYTMTPREAFDFAQAILKAAYTARERQEGILHPLGPKVLNGQGEEAKK